MIGAGLLSSKLTISFDKGETYSRYKDIEPKSNVKLTFLRRLDSLNNRLSLGVDVQSNFSDRVDSQQSYIDENKNVVDVQLTGKYTTPIIIIYFLDYKLLESRYLDFSLQAGLGTTLHHTKGSANTKITAPNGQIIYNKDTSGEKKGFEDSIKLGALATYNINEQFSIGLGASYLHLGQPLFSLSFADVSIKSKGLVATNLSLIYKF